MPGPGDRPPVGPGPEVRSPRAVTPAEAEAGPAPVEWPEGPGPEAPQPEAEAEPTPGAEVIDISARVNDQVYDQYTDAAERAVGD